MVGLNQDTGIRDTSIVSTEMAVAEAGDFRSPGQTPSGAQHIVHQQACYIHIGQPDHGGDRDDERGKGGREGERRREEKRRGERGEERGE